MDTKVACPDCGKQMSAKTLKYSHGPNCSSKKQKQGVFTQTAAAKSKRMPAGRSCASKVSAAVVLSFTALTVKSNLPVTCTSKRDREKKKERETVIRTTMRNMQLNATSLRHLQRASERFASECLEHDAHAALGEHRDILVAALQDHRHAPASLSTNNGGRCIARMFNIRKMSCQCSSPSADKSPNWGHKRQHKRKAALTRRCSGRRSWYEERSKRETKTRLEARNTKPVDDARLEARNSKADEAEKWCLRET